MRLFRYSCILDILNASYDRQSLTMFPHKIGDSLDILVP